MLIKKRACLSYIFLDNKVVDIIAATINKSIYFFFKTKKTLSIKRRIIKGIRILSQAAL